MGMLTYPLQPSTTSEISGRELPAVGMAGEYLLIFWHIIGALFDGLCITPPTPDGFGSAGGASGRGAFPLGWWHVVARWGHRLKPMVPAAARAAGAADKAHQIEGLAVEPVMTFT